MSRIGDDWPTYMPESTPRWSVRRRPFGNETIWAVYRGENWHDTFDTHAEAIIWAHRYAITTAIDNGCLDDRH